MTTTTELAIVEQIAKDARKILARCTRYKNILSTSHSEEEVLRRIEAEKLPGLDENCIYLMTTLPAKTKVEYIGGV